MNRTIDLINGNVFLKEYYSPIIDENNLIKFSNSSLTEKQLLKIALKSDFVLFYKWVMKCILCIPNLDGFGDGITESNYCEVLLNYLMNCAYNPTPINTIAIPPRAGKTQAMIIWIVWILVNNPYATFLIYSYNAEVASEYAIQCPNIIKSPSFRNIFGELTIDNDYSNRSGFACHFLGTPTNSFTLKAHGITGTQTGLGAGSHKTNNKVFTQIKVIGAEIIDDPLSASDANSIIEKMKANYIVHNSLFTRINDSALTPIIVSQQRLATDDTIGVTESLFEGQVNKLVIKAYDEINNVSIYPRKKTAEQLLHMKQTNQRLFYSQYQQSPLPSDDNIFNVEKIKLFKNSIGKDNLYYEILVSFVCVDLAMTDSETSDFNVFGHFYIVNKRNTDEIFVVLNEMNVERFSSATHLEKFLSFWRKLCNSIEKEKGKIPEVVIIESQSGGAGLVRGLEMKMNECKRIDRERFKLFNESKHTAGNNFLNNNFIYEKDVVFGGYYDFKISPFPSVTRKIDRMITASEFMQNYGFAIKDDYNDEGVKIRYFDGKEETTEAILNHLKCILNCKDNKKDDIADVISSAMNFTYAPRKTGINDGINETHALQSLLSTAKARLMNKKY